MNMVEGVYAFHMENEITVRNVKDHIDLICHTGSFSGDWKAFFSPG